MIANKHSPTLTWYLILILFIAVIAQAYLTFFTAAVFEVQIAGIYWTLPKLILPVIFYIWLITWPLQQKTERQRAISAPRVLVAAYVAFSIALLFGVYQGMQKNYIAFFGHSEMFFWTMALPMIGWSARVTSAELSSGVRLITISTSILMLFAVPTYVYRHLFGERLFSWGGVDRDIMFLIMFCLFYYFIRVFMQPTHTIRDRLAFVLFVLMTLLLFEKSVIFTVAVGLLAILAIVSKDLSRNTIKRALFIAAPALVIFAIFNQLEPNITRFYHDQLTDRWLHSPTLAGADISGGRFELWQESYRMVLAKPVAGYGIGVFVQNPRLGTTREYLTAHNIYIYAFLAMGLPGGFLALNLVLRYLRVVIAQMRTMASVNEVTLLLFSFVFAVLAYNLTNIYSISSTAYTLFGLSAGMLLYIVLYEQKDVG